MPVQSSTSHARAQPRKPRAQVPESAAAAPADCSCAPTTAASAEFGAAAFTNTACSCHVIEKTFAGVSLLPTGLSRLGTCRRRFACAAGAVVSLPLCLRQCTRTHKMYIVCINSDRSSKRTRAATLWSAHKALLIYCCWTTFINEAHTRRPPCRAAQQTHSPAGGSHCDTPVFTL